MDDVYEKLVECYTAMGMPAAAAQAQVNQLRSNFEKVPAEQRETMLDNMLATLTKARAGVNVPAAAPATRGRDANNHFNRGLGLMTSIEPQLRSGQLDVNGSFNTS